MSSRKPLNISVRACFLARSICFCLTDITNSKSVIVVGGSLVGLSAAVFLTWRGVPTVVVERHPGSSLHPRAIGFTPRTLENYRAAGIGERIPPTPTGFRLRRARVESLAGKWFEETHWTAPQVQETPQIEYSFTGGAALAQDSLESILHDRAIELGADIRFNTELIHFEQNDDGVVATLRNRVDGSEYTLHGAYLIAADGHNSPIRQKLGIGRSGLGHMKTVRSVLFRASLDEYLEKGVSQFSIDQPGLQAFLTTYRDGRWVLMFYDDAERDQDTLKTLIAQAIGRSDLEIEIIVTGRWEMTAQITNKFSSGKIFIAGDAAHTLPPSRGGYGANTGIEDAHNIAWKLAAVLSGKSSPDLLETYDAERRPIAWLRYMQMFARNDYKAQAPENAKDVAIIDDKAMEFGQLYRSKAVLGASDDLPPAKRPDEWAGQPGTRAPHLWLNKNDERISTLDLFQREWVLLAEDERWSLAAKAGTDLKFVHIGVDVNPSSPEEFRTAFGLGNTGASLIRPDGYVAWRSVDLPADPVQTLTEAFGQVAFAAK